MKALHLAPIDAYHGEMTESFDPDVCGTDKKYARGERDPDGCIVHATRIAGLAEVTVYEVDPDAGGLWSRLWPFS